MIMSLKVASIFFSIVAAAATTTNTADDESVASAPSFLKRELRVDDAVSSYSFSYRSCAYGGDGNGSTSMSYATSSKTTKTKASKASSKATKAEEAKATKCERSECVDPNVGRFIVDGSKDIGDTLLHEGKPGETTRCGCDCYTLIDGGDDPPFDPECGDTQHFAYKKVTSTNFSIKSRTCGVKCYDGEEENSSYQLTFGRVGLAVRQSLHPLAANVFISHKPRNNAEWSWRKGYGGDYFMGAHGSPDEECLWITLTRNGNRFTATYAYDPQLPGEVCESEGGTGVEEIVVDIDMTDTVYVGLAVSSEVSSGDYSYCEYTEADFESIEFVCEGEC